MYKIIKGASTLIIYKSSERKKSKGLLYFYKKKNFLACASFKKLSKCEIQILYYLPTFSTEKSIFCVTPKSFLFGMFPTGVQKAYIFFLENA